MAGGAGDDFYLVDNTADLVTETLANGKGGGSTRSKARSPTASPRAPTSIT